jgi:hypothetical protein
MSITNAGFDLLIWNRRWEDVVHFIRNNPHTLPRFVFLMNHALKHVFAYIFDLEEDDKDYIVDLLMHDGVPMNETYGNIHEDVDWHEGFTPLHHVTKLSSMKKLLVRGADPNFSGRKHDVPPFQYWLVRIDNHEADIRHLALLLQYGANPHLVRKGECSAFEWVKRQMDKRYADYIRAVYVMYLLCHVHAYPRQHEQVGYLTLEKGMTRLLFSYINPFHKQNG